MWRAIIFQLIFSVNLKFTHTHTQREAGLPPSAHLFLRDYRPLIHPCSFEDLLLFVCMSILHVCRLMNCECLLVPMEASGGHGVPGIEVKLPRGC